jgi:hypothetical protein
VTGPINRFLSLRNVYYPSCKLRFCYKYETIIPLVCSIFIIEINRLETEFFLNNIYEFISYPRGHTLGLRFKNQPVITLYGKKNAVYFENHMRHKFTL